MNEQFIDKVINILIERRLEEEEEVKQDNPDEGRPLLRNLSKNSRDTLVRMRALRMAQKRDRARTAAMLPTTTPSK